MLRCLFGTLSWRRLFDNRWTAPKRQTRQNYLVVVLVVSLVRDDSWETSLVEEPDGLSKSQAGRQTRNGSTQKSIEVGPRSCRRWKLGIAK